MFNLLEGFTLCFFFCNLAPIGPYKWLNNIFKNVSLSILHPSEVKDHFFLSEFGPQKLLFLWILVLTLSRLGGGGVGSKP